MHLGPTLQDMRAAIYTRISLDQSGQGYGVQRQLEDCLALADRLGWDVVAHYDDNDTSAYNKRKRRPGYENMLQAMKNGEFSALICWHTDRLYRRMGDLETLIDIADAGSIQIRTVQGGNLDLSTSTGRMMARILGSVANQESEHKGERQRRANAQKAAAGTWQTANRAFGYDMSGEPLEPEATAVRTAVQDVLAGKSIAQIAREWNAAGYKTTLAGRTQKNPHTGKVDTVTGRWNGTRVRRVLLNPRNAGLKVHRGEVVSKGEWTPLVDEDTHNGLVAFLTDSSRVLNTSFEKLYMGSMVYRCGLCDAPMRHAIAGNPRVRRYECTARQHVTRRGEPVDATVEELVLQRLCSPQVGLVLDDGEKIDVAALQAKRTGIQARLDELAAMFADGTIDGSQLRSGTEKLRTQLRSVDTVLADLARRSPVADLLAAGENIREEWAKLSPDVKGKIIDEVVTIRIMPSPRGRRAFDPALVVPAVWKL